MTVLPPRVRLIGLAALLALGLAAGAGFGSARPAAAAGPDVQVDRFQDEPANIIAGGSIGFLVKLVNRGDARQTGVRVTVKLGIGVGFGSTTISPGVGFTCAHTPGEMSGTVV